MILPRSAPWIGHLRTPPTQEKQSTGWRMRAGSVVLRAILVHVLLSAIAALATPALGGRRIPVVIWGVGALVLIAVLVRTTTGPSSADRPMSLGRVFIAILVGLIGAFAAFVVMINIWERRGRAH